MAKKKIEEPIVEAELNETPAIPVNTVVVKANKLNVRKKPSLDAAVIYIANKGDVFDVVAEKVNGFYKLADGEGYVMSDFVAVK